MIRSRSYITVSADVDINLDEVFEDMDDSVVLEEARRRKLHTGGTVFSVTKMRESLEDIAFELRRHRPADAARMLGDLGEQMLRLERREASADVKEATNKPTAGATA